MKIRLLSDLHIEFSSIDLSKADEDILILAGDIAPHVHAVNIGKAIAKKFKIPVLEIAGNHEYYRIEGIAESHTWEDTISDLESLADLTDKLEPGKLTFLENRSVVYDGVRFIAATLWTDMEYLGVNYAVQFMVRQMINDYKYIWSEYNYPIRLEDTISRHKESLNFITEKLNEPFNGPTVVVTHHVPSSLSVPEEYKTDKLTAAYTSRLEELILDTKPTIWIHGHTHNPFDYILGNTRIVCNPRGYVGKGSHENVIGFDPNLIIDI